MRTTTDKAVTHASTTKAGDKRERGAQEVRGRRKKKKLSTSELLATQPWILPILNSRGMRCLIGIGSDYILQEKIADADGGVSWQFRQLDSSRRLTNGFGTVDQVRIEFPELFNDARWSEFHPVPTTALNFDGENGPWFTILGRVPSGNLKVEVTGKVPNPVSVAEWKIFTEAYNRAYNSIDVPRDLPPVKPRGKKSVEKLVREKDSVPPETPKAAEEVVRRSPVRSRPGYVAPTRSKLKSMMTYVDEPTRDAFRAIAKSNGTTIENLLREVVVAIVEQQQKLGLGNLTVAETVERYEQDVRKAALRLVAALK